MIGGRLPSVVQVLLIVTADISAVRVSTLIFGCPNFGVDRITEVQRILRVVQQRVACLQLQQKVGREGVNVVQMRLVCARQRRTRIVGQVAARLNDCRRPELTAGKSDPIVVSTRLYV